MSQLTHVSAGAVLSTGTSVTLTAVEEADGSVRARVSCKGQETVLVFEEDQVWVDARASTPWRPAIGLPEPS